MDQSNPTGENYTMMIKGIPLSTLFEIARSDPKSVSRVEGLRTKMIDVEILKLRVAMRCRLSDISRMDPKYAWLPEDLKDESDFISCDGSIANGWIIDGHFKF